MPVIYALLVAIALCVFAVALVVEAIGDAMTYLLAWWHSHGTKIIGFVTGTIAAIAGVGGLIPEPHLKYYMGVIAVLTFWRGFINSKEPQQ